MWIAIWSSLTSMLLQLIVKNLAETCPCASLTAHIQNYSLDRMSASSKRICSLQKQWNSSEGQTIVCPKDDRHSWVISAFVLHAFSFNVEEMLTPAKLELINVH